MTLTTIQEQICQHLQDGLEISPKPYARIAEKLNLTEQEFWKITRDLKDRGIIRRIGPSISYKALGRVSTLVMAHVGPEKIDLTAETIDPINEVSHNYLRDHYYNLWFTLQGESNSQIDSSISSLQKKLDVQFHSLPAVRFFKLDVRFNLTGPGQAITQPPDQPQKLLLTGLEKFILFKIQTQLEITERPFDFLVDDSIDLDQVLEILNSLLQKGVIRKISAVLDHRKLGFDANVMLVCSLDAEVLPEIAHALASLPCVTHCYQRKTFENWPYNLYAMMHAKKMPFLLEWINHLVEKYKIESYQLLPTIAELKKKPVVYKF